MTSHLDDAAFAELWTNALADGTPATHPHLQTCAECRLRFTSFSNWMEDVRADAVGEADAALSGERLAAQQAHIMRRLETLERPGRVIAFPKVKEGGVHPSPVRRWIAAAAAAGLITGIGLGQMVDLRWRSNGVPTFGPERIADVGAGRGPGGIAAVPAVATIAEERALAELEEVANPRYEALQAYDTFTPRAADLIQPR